jgi:hypothetical protein
MLDQLFRGDKYTADELNARLKFFIGIILGCTLFGIVFVVLYSLIFVTQPMNGMSPVDNKFFELIIPIATFLTGTLSGIMLAGNDKDAQMKALEAATRPPTPSAPAPMPPSSFGGSGGGFTLPKSEPTLGSIPSFGNSFGGTAGTFSSVAPMPVATGSGAGPVMRNGKPGPAQEEHPII